MTQGIAVWLALLWVANPGLAIGSTSDCPSAAQVVAEIAPLLPAGMPVAESRGVAESAETDRGEVSLVDGVRWVRLLSHDERFNHERALPRALSCGEAARAAAVLLAAWEFQGRADLTGTVPPPTTPPAPSPPPDATGAPGVPGGPDATPNDGDDDDVSGDAATPTTKTVEAPAPMPKTIATAADGGARHAPGIASRGGGLWRLGLGADISVARAFGRFVIGPAVELVFGPPIGLGLRLQLATTTQYSMALDMGRANWTRSSVGAGTSLTARRGRLGLQAHADLLAAIFAISGQDFAVNAQGTQVAIGAALGGRAIVVLGGGDLWLDVTLTAWPGQHQVILSGAPEGRDLPAAEVSAAVGVDFFVWP